MTDDEQPAPGVCPPGRASVLARGTGKHGQHKHHDHPHHISDEDFEQMIIRAIDRLPEQFREIISKVPVVISDQGRERHAYGLYQGDGIARDNYPDRIIIFKDTLTRDFGHDHALLAAQVERTVRHELGHHLGYDEGGVRGLGL
ncbi:MAG: metallopeptidase family protein [Solirubrobacterales bacterium]|nr:metallopeptidase family protein [Solirubrobacterales bacterium]MCB8915432.1 metallopeptidase family protein [Thermoleophilales bacterium]